MPAPRRRVRVDAQVLRAGFAAIRDELQVPVDFPADAAAEAASAARDGGPVIAGGRADLTDVPFVTIDPPGSRDLDQAVHAEREQAGPAPREAERRGT